MRKLIVITALLCAFAGIARADVQTWESDTMTTNTHVDVSDALPVSGYLEKIEAWNSCAGCTSTVVVASYNAAGTAVDTLATVTLTTTTPKVIRTRVIGTTNAGVDLAGALAYGATNLSLAATTALIAPYERVMLGGTTKITATGTITDGTNTVNVRIFYDRTER